MCFQKSYIYEQFLTVSKHELRYHQKNGKIYPKDNVPFKLEICCICAQRVCVAGRGCGLIEKQYINHQAESSVTYPNILINCHSRNSNARIAHIWVVSIDPSLSHIFITNCYSGYKNVSNYDFDRTYVPISRD